MVIACTVYSNTAVATSVVFIPGYVYPWNDAKTS